MNNHQATEQMLGYLYQVRYALYLLLDNDNEQTQISIEKFDDIGFNDGDTPERMIQLKHHTKEYGDLGNASTDIWRTIKVWADFIFKDKSLLLSTKFLIITTAKAPDNTAASYLKPLNRYGKRDTKKAFEILNEVTKKSKNKAHKGYYDAFNNLEDDLAKRLIDNIYILDASSNIIDVMKNIKKAIRYSCFPQHEDKICERLEGWWYKKSIEYLSSDEPVFINQSQIRSFIVSISNEYSEDNLPIDIQIFDEIEIENLSENDRVFYEQLRLICLSDNKINLAIREYYRAFKQRANWVRDDLLYINELDKYEKRLIDEWQRLFYDMEEELEDYEGEVTDKIKQKFGKALYKKVQDQDIRIRERCCEPFVMRGSYHLLANRLSVGWYIDFKNRLQELLGIRGE